MAEIKQSLTAAGSLLLATAAGIPAFAQERHSSRIVAPAIEQLAPSGVSGFSTPLEAAPVETPPVKAAPVKAAPVKAAPFEEFPAGASCPVQQPRRKRSKPVAQWWERHKARCRDRAWGYPEEFIPAPLGAAVNANASLQTAQGQVSRMVLRHYDFLPLTDQLKPRSKIALLKYGEWACHGAGPLLIEPTPGRPDLDEARRVAVLNELHHGPFALPPELIAIGIPGGGGLRGAEALVVERNLIMQTTSRGSSSGGGGGGGSLLGGGGMPGGGTMGGGMSSGSSGGAGSTGGGY